MTRRLRDKRNLQSIQKHALRFLIGLFRAFLFTTLAFVVLYPIFSKISASFMSSMDVYDMSVQYIPRRPNIANYIAVFKQLDISRIYPLTMQFTLTIAVLQMLAATIIGYGLARFKFMLNGPMTFIVLAGLVIPPDLLLLPLYTQFRYFDFLGLVPLLTGKSLSLINTQWPMIILAVTGTGFRSGLYILLMRQSFRNMPKELEEAAYIDGAAPIKTFISIMLPSSRTMMITIVLFASVWTWLDTTFIPILMSDYPLLGTKVDVLINVNAGEHTTQVARNLAQNAGIVFVILPLMMLYVFTQRYFVQSLERSGLVG